MFKKRKNVGISLDVGKSENRILRTLRLDKAFATSPVGLEETNQENFCANPWREIRSTMLEMEFRKAQALMAYQRNRQRFC